MATTTKNGTKPQTEEVVTALELKPVKLARMEVRIQGVTPLIVHAWSEKERKRMREAGKGPKEKKGPRDPEGDYNAARYILDKDRDGFPAVSFKTAIADAARHFDGVTMTALKQWMFVLGEGAQQLVHIQGERSMREDMVRVGQGIADLRWRPQYWPWEATLKIEWVKTALTPDSILTLVDAAGIGGIGEWRPSSPKGKSGTYGRFEVVQS